jgi:hypothetical protein
MSSGFFRDEAAHRNRPLPLKTRSIRSPESRAVKQRAWGVPRRRMLGTSGKEGAKFLASDASPATRVRGVEGGAELPRPAAQPDLELDAGRQGAAT